MNETDRLTSMFDKFKHMPVVDAQVIEHEPDTPETPTIVVSPKSDDSAFVELLEQWDYNIRQIEYYCKRLSSSFKDDVVACLNRSKFETLMKDLNYFYK